MMDYLTQIFQVFSLLVYWGFAISVVLLAIFGGKIEIEVNGLAQIIRLLKGKAKEGREMKVTCPVCNGTGTDGVIYHGPNERGHVGEEAIMCKACDGFGTVDAGLIVKEGQ